MMRFIHVSVAVLSLLSVGQSAPVTSCESLIKPVEIQGRDQLLGKWTLLAEATNIPGAKQLAKTLVESSWMKLTAGKENDTIDILQGEKMLGGCFTLKAKMTLENSSLFVGPPLNSSVGLLSTGCPDCLVHYTKSQHEGETYSGVTLLSRRLNVTAAELEEFKKQVECLKLSAPTILIPKDDLCPEESPLNTDLTATIQNLNPDILNQMEGVLRGEDDIDSLIQLMSSLDSFLDT